MTNKPPHLIHPPYRSDIDGLRALAILSVLSFHAFPSIFPGGFVGVDIFFVISGFLISTIIFSSLERDRFSLLEFYIRRIRRIFPALIVVLIACLVAGWNLLLPDEYKQLGKHVAAGAGFVQNFFLYGEAGYFDKLAETKPLLHLWSLAVEEQFYIFWPLLLAAIWKRRHWSFLKVTAIIAVASFAVCQYQTAENPTAAFYLPLSRFWELMAGGILAYLSAHHPVIKFQGHVRPAKYRDAKAVLGLMLILASWIFLDRSKSFPGMWALLPTLGSFFLISAGQGTWVNDKLLSNKFMVGIGLISYPLYLWHWVLLSFLRINEAGTPSANARIVALVLSFALAWLTYRFIEKPVQHNTRSRKVIVGLCTILFVVGFVGKNIYERDGLGFRLMKISPELMGARPDIASEWRRNQCFLEPPVNMYSDQCIEGKRPLVFLWGDSHAAALYPGLKAMQQKYHFGIAQYTASGCKPFAGTTTSPNCQKPNDQALDALRNSNPDIVILHANWSGQNDLDALNATVASIQKAGVKKILLIGSDPLWNDDLPNILFAYHRKFHEMPPVRMQDNNAEIIHRMDVLMREFAIARNIRYLSSLDLLCNQNGCLTRLDETGANITSMDTSHLTPKAAIYEAQFILPLLFGK